MQNMAREETSPHRMRMTQLATGLCVIGAALSLRAEAVPAELRSYVERFTGPQPTDCGEHPLVRPFVAAGAEELQRSLACGLEAATSRKPFWTSKQDQGIDSLIFQGIIGTTEGLTYRFSYDSAPCGSPGCPGKFTIERCQKPTVFTGRGGRADFACR